MQLQIIFTMVPWEDDHINTCKNDWFEQKSQMHGLEWTQFLVIEKKNISPFNLSLSNMKDDSTPLQKKRISLIQ
jgi:hypothetical protein